MSDKTGITYRTGNARAVNTGATAIRAAALLLVATLFAMVAGVPVALAGEGGKDAGQPACLRRARRGWPATRRARAS